MQRPQISPLPPTRCREKPLLGARQGEGPPQPEERVAPGWLQSARLTSPSSPDAAVFVTRTQRARDSPILGFKYLKSPVICAPQPRDSS